MNTHARARPLLGGALLVVVAGFALVVGATGFVAVAAVVRRPRVSFLSALLLVGLTTYALNRPVLQLCTVRSRHRAACWSALLVTVLVGGPDGAAGQGHIVLRG